MATLPLLRGESISLEDALDDDDNILRRLDYAQEQREFCAKLVSVKADIEATVSFHLGAGRCEVAEESSWMFGSYNVCLPVTVNPPSEDRVIFRIPLPYKIGENDYPGNVEEKLRCEVATYIWMHQNCPTVPIPVLYGFAFPSGPAFVQPSALPLGTRIRWSIMRTARSWLGLPTPCPYIPVSRSSTLQMGYMIISFVQNGRMLSDTWGAHLLEDKLRRQTLFGDIAKIMLSLNSTPLPRIGSLTLDNSGFVTLTNRPLTLRLQTLENEGIPTFPRNSTYQAVEPYLLDLLQCHNNRIFYQPNAIHDKDDGEEQLSALTMMHALLHQFISRQYRHGPFVLTLTDLHPSNIFVDDEWHITSLIDLEWACSFPIELQTPPYWLTGRPIDNIEHGEPLQTFEKIITEFMDAFEEQERDSHRPGTFQAGIMRDCWARGSYWYFQAVHSPKGLLRVFREHIQPRYCEKHCTKRVFDRTVSPYWCVAAEELIQKKVDEEAAYRGELRKRFNN